MFAALPAFPDDAILRLMALYREDPRPGKLDLGVGVYRDDAGHTPVMRAVREAERHVWAAQVTKSYVGLLGAEDFAAAITKLVLGDACPGATAVAATPGGTGALRIGFELVRMAGPGATVWLPAEGWPNHDGILAHLGVPIGRYRHAASDGTLDAAGLHADLSAAAPGDVVLLHGCCHNPTGIDPDAAQWGDIADLMVRRGLMPLVDLAYLGFGDGIEADAVPVRRLAEHCPEMLVAVSCSKSFGVYRDRVGALIALARDPARTGRLRGALAHLNRAAYSFPPDHGARVVTRVLTDPDLRADWQAELDAMRGRVAGLRAALADGLRRASGSDRFGAIAGQKGMFSRLGLATAQVESLRARHGVYLVGDSRINIAGLRPDVIPHLCTRIAETL